MIAPTLPIRGRAGTAHVPSLLIVWAMFFLPGPITIQVRPTFAIAPGSFQCLVIIERHDNNRQLEWGFTGPEERHTSISIDGAQRARVFYPKPWEQLSGGDYIAYASLTRITQGRTVITRTEQAFRAVYPDDF